VVKKKGEPALTLSPGRLDPANPVWTASRKPLVGEFTFKGNDVFVIANHFDAKLGDQNADGRYQYPAQSSAVQRSGQALAEHRFVSQILAIDKKDDFDGVSEVLDHILVSNGIKKFTYQVVHLNSEYANQVRDHDPQVVDIKP